MDFSTWLAFTIMATLIVMSPGPNGVIVLKTVGQHGYKPALAVILGLFCATFAHGLFVLFGLSTLLIYIPQAFLTIKVLGAIYLCYLGLKSLKQFFNAQRPPTNDSISDKTKDSITNPNDTIARLPSFMKVGLLTQLLNPKVSALYLAVIPNFVDFTAATATVDTLILTLTHASIVGSWFVVVASVSVKLLPYFKDTSVGKWMNGLAGLVMLYFSAMLLTYETKRS